MYSPENKLLSKWEEEKKESSPIRSQEGLYVEPLPDRIKDKKYESELQLLEDLDRFGLCDLRVVLDVEGFAVWQEMPGEQHRGAIDVIFDRFDEWKGGRMLKGRQERNVFVDNSFNTPKNRRRVPDFAIFGPDRLLGGRREIRSVDGKFMNPHVIFQFSWTNEIVKEALAVDDMMNFAGVGAFSGHGRPNVAYLIKAKRRGTENDSPVYGFDIFEVGQGENTPNEPTMKYRVGSREDTVISVHPAFMGLDDDTGEPLRIEMSDIRGVLERLGTVFVSAREDEM